MSSTNAPQPTPTGAAEVFDDTIQPAPPTISTDGGVGPNNMEAPMHAGSVNTFDVKYYSHWMTLNAVTWDITAAPGSLIWSVPIHPDRSHQWLAWDAKKYYVWAGGFDFSVKVAGTGFHAGALLIARIPPGFDPQEFRTINDVSEFDCKQIDPKTLEVVSLGVMDQRPIMYHYFPLDLKDRNSYGGHFAIYCLLPLRTSSTGQSQISLQIWTKPSQNFTMDQLIPIRQNKAMITKPFEIENALNFITDKSSPQVNTKIKGMTAWTKKSKAELTFETLNTYGFDGEPVNGTPFPRLDNVEYFEVNTANRRIGYLDSNNFHYYRATGDNGINCLSDDFDEANMLFGKLRYYPNDDDHVYPGLGDCQGNIKLVIAKDGVNPVTQEVNWPCKFHKPKPDDIAKGADWEAVPEYTSKSKGIQPYLWFDNTPDLPNVTDGTPILAPAQLNICRAIGFQFNSLSWDLTYHPKAPPIDESIITFQTDSGDVSMPYELAQTILNSGYKDMIGETQSMAFELWDEYVSVPILPLRLSYQGLLTTTTQSTDRIFTFTDPERYRCYFVGIIPTSTPLVGNKLLSTAKEYSRNLARSRRYMSP